MFSGRFTDALQALNDWLYRAEPQLAEDMPVGGDKDMVSNLIDKHKVRRCIIISYMPICFTFLHFNVNINVIFNRNAKAIHQLLVS